MHRGILAATLVLLALIVAAFVATWVTIPSGRYEVKNLTTGEWQMNKVGYPARLFHVGLDSSRFSVCIVHSGTGYSCLRSERYERVDLQPLRQRVVVIYAGLAAVVALLGFGIAALLRPSRHPSREPV